MDKKKIRKTECSNGWIATAANTCQLAWREVDIPVPSIDITTRCVR